ncbi:MAG: PrsW family intramembrane metalloprotease [Nocardiopsaceae bacterium]|nr:PrsW family intramembrane metalloprotease [Nocardiopsaceae bacterium]
MDEQAMLTRDLVLRVCANATEFDQGWTQAAHKGVVPFTAPRDTALIDRIVAAGRAVGVDRLLVCRTRAEFAYEPVTEVPTDTRSVVRLIRDWGDEPTDLLFVVEDFSAAVLVTSSTLTVAAGPDDFLRPLVGSDTARARTRFAEEARDRRDPELLRAAQRYNCLEPGARHARNPRGPGPDMVERLAVRMRSLREKTPGTVAGWRALRGVWTWAMLAALLLAPVFVAPLWGVLPVLIGMVWLLAQLAWLARSRTVGFATLVRVLLLGALMLWPIALAEHALAGAFGASPNDWFAYTYIAVPVEEVAKFAPLLLFRLVGRRRFRRFAAVDYLLLAAASGAGLHLAEEGLRMLSGGVGTVAPQYGAFMFLPGAADLPEVAVHFSGHAVITGLIGGALGMAIVGHRRYGIWLWLLPMAAAAVAGVEHMVFNAALAGVDPTPATMVVYALTGSGAATRWMLLLLLIAAVLMDYRAVRSAGEVTPPLPGEPPLAGLRRWAHGRAIRLGVRVPGDIAPLFRRIALAWARLPITLGLAASAIAHEYTVQLVAAQRGPDALAAAWRFLRERRAYAMGAARAGDRPWRRFPTREELEVRGRDLESALAPATATAVLAVSAVWLLISPPLSGTPADHGAAYAVAALQEAVAWYGSVPAGGRPWVWVGAVALFSVLVSGWTVPRAYPHLSGFLRDPAHGMSRALGAFAPGQVPYAIAYLVGAVLPRSVDQLLRPRR